MKLFQSLKEIPITTLPGLRIGNAQNYEAMTGVTVLSMPSSYPAAPLTVWQPVTV